MTKAKRHLVIGTGLVAALTCSLAPVPAFAALGDPLPALAAAALPSGVAVEQTDTPRLTPGSSGRVTVKITNTSGKNGRGGSTFKIVAPAGTTFANSTADIVIVGTGYSTSWAGTVSDLNRTIVFDRPAFELNAGDSVLISFSLRADIDSRLSGTVGDGQVVVVGRTSLPIFGSGFGYFATPAAQITQQGIPFLTQGASGTAVMTLSNNVPRSSSAGTSFVATAPAGTVFSSSEVPIRLSNGSSGTWSGVLSGDGRTLTVVRSPLEIATGGSLELRLPLRSDAGNTRTGMIGDGELRTTAGNALPIGLAHPIVYTASYVAPNVSMTQTVSPRLEPGQTADVAIRYVNHATVPTPTGSVLELTAPAGAAFTSNAFALTQDTYPSGWNLTGTLSADKRTLTMSLPQHSLAAGGWGQIVVALRSDADNNRSGRIGDGRLVVTGGSALPVGTSSAVAYDAVYIAPQIRPVALATPTIGGVVSGTARPLFSGAGTPDATITVTGSSGRVVATTAVKSDGTWSVPAGFDLVSGSYSGTVSQSVDGSSARYEFSLVNAPAQPGVTPVALTGPALDAALDAGRPVFTGKGHPGAAVTVRGSLGTLLGSGTVDAQGSWSIESTVTLAPGYYTGAATQVANGQSSSAGFRFTVRKPEAQIAAVTLISPAIDAKVNPGRVTFSGKGHPGGTVTVRGTFGTVLGTATVNAQGAWSVESTISLAAGSYSGTVNQNAEGKVSSTVFSFAAVVNTDVRLTSPAVGAVLDAGRPVFTGTGKPGAAITVQGSFGTVLASTTVNAAGTWAASSTVSLVAGAYTGTARQVDGGTTTTASFAFTVR